MSELYKPLLGTGKAEVGCDECFQLLDQYVDTQVARGNAAGYMPKMHAHLDGCPVCFDEYESMLAFKNADA
jgi:hypothetical protein